MTKKSQPVSLFRTRLMMWEKKAGYRSPAEVFMSGIRMILSRVLISSVSAGVVYS